MTAVMYGPDISGNNPGIDLSKITADFANMKATGSGGFVSQACDPQFQQAKRLGLCRGVYHFYRDSAGDRGDAVQSAQFFVAQTRGYWDGMTIPQLDWESVMGPGDPILADVGWMLRFLREVFRLTRIRAMVYMSASTAHMADFSPVVKEGYGIWVAAYVLGYQRIDGYAVPTGLAPVAWWPFVAMWQFTSNGHLPGYAGALDLNVFYGDRAAWIRYATPAGAAPVTVPKVTAPKPAPKPAPRPVVASGTYQVKPGDSLSVIAAKFGTTWQVLQQLNGLPDANLIKAGQVLRVTGHTPVPVSRAVVRTCRVTPGDTLSSIGAQFRVPWQTIAQLNGLAAPYTIFPDQVLRLR